MPVTHMHALQKGPTRCRRPILVIASCCTICEKAEPLSTAAKPGTALSLLNEYAELIMFVPDRLPAKCCNAITSIELARHLG